MELMVIVGLVGLGAALFGVGHVVRGCARVEEEPADGPRHPYIHILRSPQELQHALSRAAEAERGIAEVVTARANRYEASLRPRRAPVTPSAGAVLIGRTTDTTPAHRRSA
jgi:hypothetical protein